MTMYVTYKICAGVGTTDGSTDGGAIAGGAPDGKSGGRQRGVRVYVGNLDYSVRWQELKDHMRSAVCSVSLSPKMTSFSDLQLMYTFLFVLVSLWEDCTNIMVYKHIIAR